MQKAERGGSGHGEKDKKPTLRPTEVTPQLEVEQVQKNDGCSSAGYLASKHKHVADITCTLMNLQYTHTHTHTHTHTQHTHTLVARRRNAL
jgi:hypothetical protein